MMNSKRGITRETNQIRIAIPNKGRLSEMAHNLLRQVGLQFEAHDRKLSATLRNMPGEVLYLRAGDIPRYVAEDRVDLAITGRDLVEEYHLPVQVFLDLGFGHTDLVVAVPEGSGITDVKQLQGKTVATTFPRLARKFLKKLDVEVDLVMLGGAVEAAPMTGLADAIIDLVASGSTLRMNNLVPIETLMHSEAVLIGRMNPPAASKHLVDTLVTRMESVVRASKKRYIMMNAPAKKLEEIKKVAPGLASPTVMTLTEPGMIAVHSVVDAADVWDIVDKLRKIGASGILVLPVE
ncbi:MAG: ATP phosphoribosyltransferase, partial [bacterium]|nr:ATP phosphoribosyltransferase [bacterium]